MTPGAQFRILLGPCSARILAGGGNRGPPIHGTNQSCNQIPSDRHSGCSSSETRLHQIQQQAKNLLAGLIQKNEIETTVKVPLLGDIPILGWLFRNTSNDKIDNEVIFVITPHILAKVG